MRYLEFVIRRAKEANLRMTGGAGAAAEYTDTVILTLGDMIQIWKVAARAKKRGIYIDAEWYFTQAKARRILLGNQ